MSDKEIKDLFGDDFEVSCDFLDHANLRGDIPPVPPLQEPEQEQDFEEYEIHTRTDRKAGRSTPPARTAPARHTKTVKTKKKKKRGLPNLGKPISKTAKAAKSGGRALSRTVGPLLRLATMALIIYILFLLGSRFWNGKNAFGSLSTILSERNYALGAYLCTGAILLFYGLLSLFWAYTGPKTAREDNRIRKLDTGRGFIFFILIYLGSFLSRFVVPLLPAGHSSIEGVGAALSIYSEMSGILFPLCAAGVICCLLRKFIFK